MRALEAVNGSDASRSTEDCGPMFVDANAEGYDVDPWQADSRMPVPPRFPEHGETEVLRAALIGLLDWAAAMGGWEGEAWRTAERVVGRVEAVGIETE